MKVRVVFRNYIPLYSCYCSFWLKPVKGVEVLIPKVKKMTFIFKIYRLFRGMPFYSFFVEIGQKIFFSEKMDFTGIDLLFYTGMLPKKDTRLPYVVDFEHIHSLFDYATVNSVTKERVWYFLNSKNCVGILPWSEAALKTLKCLYGKKYQYISNKTSVLYPALPIYKKVYKGELNNDYVRPSKSIKFLFVGRDYKRKGLIELLHSFMLLTKKYKNIDLYVISNMGTEERKKYDNNKIHFFKAEFSQEETIKKFFLTCDVFILPTHADTFGMVLLEALSSGLPVITTDQFASKEIILNEINGLFVKSKELYLDEMLIPDKKHTGADYNDIEELLVNDLYLKMKYLIDDPDKLKALKEASIRQFDKGGKFSIETRNKKLKVIYAKADQK